MTLVGYLIGLAAFWAIVALIVPTEHDLRRARLGFVAGAVGGLAGWLAFRDPAAILLFGIATSSLLFEVSFRRPVRQWPIRVIALLPPAEAPDLLEVS